MSTDKLPGRGNSTAQTQNASFFPVQFAPQIAAQQPSVSPLTQAWVLQDNALSQQTAMNMALNYHLPHWEYCCPYGQTFNPVFLNSDSESQAAMEITGKKKKKSCRCHTSRQSRGTRISGEASDVLVLGPGCFLFVNDYDVQHCL